MNEVEKMYRLANVKAKEYCDRDSDACMNCCPEWKNRQNCWKYKSVIPPFTAEKQIAIFKMFCKRYLEVSQHVEENGDLCFGIKATVGDYAVGFNKDFAECLADFVNCLWQDLTDTERKKIKEILE